MTKARRLIAMLASAVLLAACQAGGDGQTPSAAPATAPPAAPAAVAAKAGDPRGQVFIDKGCVQCHKVSKLGVEGAEIGPDLSFAASDVRARFGTDLESFLKNPTGTMQIVLSAQIKLSEEEREDIAELLIDLEKDHDKDHDTDRNDRKDRK